jgi:hypothetical protein
MNGTRVVRLERKTVEALDISSFELVAVNSHTCLIFERDKP